MKTLKIMLAGIVILFASIAANAKVKATNKPTQADVVNMYIAAIKTGNTNNLTTVLNNDMQFNLERGENVSTLNKTQLLDYLKNNTLANEVLNTTTTVLTDDGNIVNVKVKFQYSGYTRIDEITLEKSFGWKIATVNSTFK